MKKIVFVSDYFRDDLIGGAELNDGVLISRLLDRGYDIEKRKSDSLTVNYLRNNGKKFYIISNFIGLPQDSKRFLADNLEYIIYEHDHKYLDSRDPSVFCKNRSTLEGLSIGPNNIINSRFYYRAKAVICLSSICKKILETTLNCNNVKSIGTSLWSHDRLDRLEKISKKKTKGCMVLKSQNPTKNMSAAVEYCHKNNLKYDLVGGLSPDDFLEEMAKYETLVYIPKVLETFCRLVAEAKMLECKVRTVSGLLGAASEPHIRMSGKDLINETRIRVDKAIDLFQEIIDQKNKNEKTKKIAFIGKFRNLYDEEGKAQALEKIGYEVVRFDEDTFDRSSSLNNQQLLLKTNPDFVFYTKLRIPNQNQFMVNMIRNDIKTVCWVPDLYFGTPREIEARQKHPMFHADYVFSPDGGNQNNFQNCRINHIPLKDGIHADNCSVEPDSEVVTKEIDILFVGSLNMEYHGKNRYDLLHFLQDTYGDRFVWVGKNNSNEYREEKLTKLIRSAKIVIGDCVESKNVWSNRLYETIGRGGFIIHPYVEGIDDHYTDKEHFVTFERNNFAELEEKINYYLLNDKERESIINSGIIHTKKFHTLDHRAKKIIETIESKT